MSKETSTFIMRFMPYARGCQFRTEFWRNKGIEVELVILSKPKAEKNRIVITG